jgi:hypothetical protein
MSCKCAHFWGAISLLFLFLTTQAVSAPNCPNNGRFELYEFNDVLDINVPTGWQHENYTDVIGYLEPNNPRYPFWKIDRLLPFEGNYFLTLRTGSDSTEPYYAKVWQTITVDACSTLIGAYFFGTYDWLEWNDYAEIKLIPVTDPNLHELELVHVSVQDVGDYNSMKGWERFAYTFDTNESGTYYLTIAIYNVLDEKITSYFAVDGLVLCESGSNGGDINLDCTTDFSDFALMAVDWLCDCNDPIYYKDPNTNCQLDTDLTGDGHIDSNDLQVMSDHWLEGIKQ